MAAPLPHLLIPKKNGFSPGAIGTSEKKRVIFFFFQELRVPFFFERGAKFPEKFRIKFETGGGALSFPWPREGFKGFCLKT